MERDRKTLKDKTWPCGWLQSNRKDDRENGKTGDEGNERIEARNGNTGAR